MTLNAPILSMADSDVSLGGPILRAVDSTVTLNPGGGFLSMSGGSLEGTASLVDVSGGTLNLNGGVAPIQLTNGASLSLSNGGSLMQLTASATATSSGPFLDSASSDITINGPIFALNGGSTITQTAGPVIRLRGGSLTADRILGVSGTGNTLDTTGTLLDLQGTSVTLRIMGDGPEDYAGQSRNILAHNEPFIRMADSDFTLTEPGESFINPGSHWLMNSDGVGLIATSTSGNTISLAGPLLNLDSVTLTATDPQVQLTNMTVTQSGSQPNSLIEVLGASANPITTAGPLLAATNSTLSTEASFLHVGNGVQFSGTSPTALVQLTGSSVTTAGPFALFDGGARVGPGGSGVLLDSVNSDITSSGPIFSVRGGSTVTQTGGTLVRLSGGSLDVSGGYGESDGTGNRIALGGTLLDATDASVHLGAGVGYGNGTDVMSWTQPAGVPQVRLTNSSLTSNDIFLNFSDGTSMYNGILLVASGSTITLQNTGTNLTDLMKVGDGKQVTTTSTAPLLQLSTSTVTAGTHLVKMEPDYSAIASPPPSLTLAGPLLGDSGSTFDVAGHFLRLRDGATLAYNNTTQPLLQFSGSTVGMDGSLFNMGSGVGQPGSTASLAGPLLSATNSDFDSGPVKTFVSVYDGGTFASTTADPLMTLSGGSITTKGHVFRVGLNNTWNSSTSSYVTTDSRAGPEK